MIDSIVDLNRYPIDDPANPKLQSTIESSRKSFATCGALQLPHFIRQDVAKTLIAGAHKAKPDAHRMEGNFPPYSDAMDDAVDTTLPADHPSRMHLPASHLFIPGDLIRKQNPLRTLYENTDFQRFLKAILNVPKLHPVADTMGNVNMLIYEPGDQNGWHFDTTDFVVSIMLQPAESGGQYQYLPDLRTPNNENLPAIAWRMQHPDAPQQVQECAIDPASLFLFKGKYTMHRVTHVAGQTDRIIAILSYHPNPGHMISASSKRAMYGRESPMASDLTF